MYSFIKKSEIVFFIACLFISLCHSTQVFAQDSNVEYKIKASYLYNFTKFISWPKDELATFNICIVGKDPFGSIINPIEMRKVKDKPIRLHRFRFVTQAKNCHIIYFSESIVKVRNLRKFISKVLIVNSENPTLSVSESNKFTRVGGMISFFPIEEKIKLSINLSALKASGLQVSAKLLEVAEVYKGKFND